jgi:hypothetical protein
MEIQEIHDYEGYLQKAVKFDQLGLGLGIKLQIMGHILKMLKLI